MNPFRSYKHALGALTIVGAVGVSLCWSWYTGTVNLGERIVSVQIKREMTFADVTSVLSDSGIISYPKLFKICARIQGLDKRLWVGRYDFSGEVSPESILNDLSLGNVATLSVTIPEGLRALEIAGIVSSELNFDSAQFVASCFDTQFCLQRYQLTNLEGHLFPETYSFPVDFTLTNVLDKLVGSAKEMVDSVISGLEPQPEIGDSLVLSGIDILTMASIIEAEATEGAERGKISSVYHNRLRKRMRLQADPTVRYALNLYHRALYYKDLKFSNPYNTYTNYGLPPGPINSPGKASIEAALNPELTDLYYFVADGTGKHIFTRTLREHERAKEDTRSARRRNR